MDDCQARPTLIGAFSGRATAPRLSLDLEAEYEAGSIARRNSALRAYLVVTALMNILCVAFDAEFGIPTLGLVVRIGLVTPLFVAAICLLSERRAIWLQGLVFAVPILAVVCESVVLGSLIGGLAADRYIGAAGIAAFTVNLASLMRFRHAVVLGIANVIAISGLTVVMNSSTWTRYADLLVFAVMMTTLTLHIAMRLERSHRNSFLMGRWDRQQTEALVRTNAELERLSKTDALTGVANRRAFDAVLKRTVARHEPIGLLMIDIDHFKAFNDAAGHEAGDICLRQVAEVIEAEASAAGASTAGVDKRGGCIARMGGEEFSIILPTGDRDTVYRIAERIRHAVQARNIEHPGLPPGRCVTVSVGAATLPDDRCVLDGGILLKDADDALYVSKIKGRNRTSFAGALSLDMPDYQETASPPDEAEPPIASAA